MFVYIVSNANKTLGVFSSITAAQKYYTSLNNQVNVKLEECSVDSTNGRDMSMMLEPPPGRSMLSGSFSTFPSQPRRNIQFDFDKMCEFDACDMCDMCGGENCKRDGMCFRYT
jgi:hypothetical protein